jgi:hypothetical protein
MQGLEESKCGIGDPVGQSSAILEGAVRGSPAWEWSRADHSGMLGREAGELRVTTKATHE